MANKRNRHEIIRLILEAVREGRLTRSGIMYAAMLNFAQANEYTALMTKNDLLDYDSSERRFHIKEKGRELLEIMDKCDSVFSKQALEVVTLPQI